MKRIVCLGLGVLLITAGCGKKIEEKIAEKVTEKLVEHGTDGKAKVDLSKNAIKVETKDGSLSLGSSSKIPEGFPSDIFIFKPSEVTMSMNNANEYSVGLKTGKDVAEITEAYKKAMLNNGWKQEAFMDLGGRMVMKYEKEKRSASILISRKDDATIIAISASAEKPASKKM